MKCPECQIKMESRGTLDDKDIYEYHCPLCNYMIPESVVDALESIKPIIKSEVGNWLYHGVLDITEHLPFQGIAEQSGMTNEEYEQLIHEAQAYGEKILSMKS